MRGHPYQACTPSINRHAGFVQTYEFKSVSKADSLKFGTHPDQATRTAAIEIVDRQVTTNQQAAAASSAKAANNPDFWTTESPFPGKAAPATVLDKNLR